MKKGKPGKMLQRAFCLLLMLCLCLGSLPVSTAAATDHEHIEEHAAGDITLPATVDGKVVLSWTVDGEEKKPGDVVDATAPRRAAFFRAPVTSGVNSVKITSHMEGTGIRFTADINRTDFEALVALYGERAISYGMLITPDEYVQRAGGVFTREALQAMLEQQGRDPSKAFVQVNAGAFFRTDETTLTVAGSLYAFSNATYNNNPAFTAVAFIDIDSDGDGQTDMTVYGDYAPMASHTAVTILRGGRAAATDTQKGWIDTILARFRAYTPDHLLCPHELTAVAAKAPTCTTAGIRAHYVCELCGEFFADDMAVEQLPIVYPNVSALGHDYENGFCTRCGDYRGSIDTDDGFFDPTLGGCDPSAPDIDWDLIGGGGGSVHHHSLTYVSAKAPTCTEGGNLAHYVCSGCGKLFRDEDGKNPIADVALPALGHAYLNGTCTACGATAGGETLAPGLYQTGTSTLISSWDTLVQNGDIILDGTVITDANTALAGDLVISASVTSIGFYAFYNCYRLASVTFGENSQLTSIGSYAFWNHMSLSSITIPDSVTSIGEGAFSSCDSLASITVAAGNTVYHSEGNCIIETASKTLIAGCKNSIIPADGSVTSIGYRAFYVCDSLASITIPASVTRIGSSAFYGCDSLASITIPASVTRIGYEVFSSCDSLASITVAAGNTVYHSEGNCIIETASKTLIAGCKNSIIPADGSVTNIGNYAFRGCTSLASIAIPASVTSIGEYAFSHCGSLASITIPASVTSISEYAFFDCYSLASVTFGENSQLTSIGYRAFSYCDSLASVKVGENSQLTSIGEGAFSSCDSLASITIPASVTSIGDYAFDYCYSLASVTFEKTGGWSADSTALSATALSNPATAAGYLTSTYYGRTWTRTPVVTAISAKAPTCTTAGNIAYWVDEAGKYYSDAACTVEISLEETVLPATGHSYANGVCTVCGERDNSVLTPDGGDNSGSDLDWDLVVDEHWGGVHQHSLSFVAATAPTCTKEGNIAHYRCADCGALFSDAGGASALTDVTLPKASHTYTNGVCTVCGGDQLPGLYAADGNTLISSWDALVQNGSVTLSGTTLTAVDTALSGELVVKDGITDIGSGAFNGCSALTVIRLPDSLTTVGDRAFYYCSALTAITIPASVTYIGSWAITGCTALASITVAAGNPVYHGAGNCIIETASGKLVAGCKTSVIPAGVVSIANYAFYGCAGLTSVTLPNSVLSIGSLAFCGCTDLEAVYFGKTNGWSAGSVALAEAALTNPATAAEYLSATYYQSKWTRTPLVIPTPATAPTCTEVGNIAYWTDEDGRHYSDAECTNEISLSDTVVPATGHSLKRTGAVAPTCTTAGNILYYTCSVCGLRFSDAQGRYEVTNITVPATGHSLKRTGAVAPTCTEAGNITYYTCSVCGLRFSDAQGRYEVTNITVPATGHDLREIEATAPTCTGQGSIKYYYCVTCMKRFSDTAGKNEITDISVPATGHSLVKTDAVAPTCTEAGSIEYYTCSVCGKRFSDAQGRYEVTNITVPATGHSMRRTAAVEPTCTEAGNITYYTCGVCGKHYSSAAGTVEITLADTVVAAEGHSMMLKTDAVAPSCLGTGSIEYYTCFSCGKRYSDAQGNNEVTDITVPATGHSLTKIDAVAPTCTEAGSIEYYTCSACGKRYSDAAGRYEVMSLTVPALGHSLVKTEAVAPTCTEVGNVAYYTCSVCGKRYSDAQGTNEITDTVVPPKGHTLMEIEAVPPTCTEAGNVGYYTCFACGKLFSDAQGENEITDIFAPAPGHSLVKTAAVSATCIQAGNIEYYTCSVCGNHYRDAAGRVAIALKDTVLPATGKHTYADGVCTGCGKHSFSGDVPIGEGGDNAGSDLEWDLI